MSFDEEIAYEVELSTLDLSPIYEVFKKVGKPLNSEKLQNLRLIKNEHGKKYPTNALLILLGYYPHCMVKCAKFKGVTMELFLDKKEYSGNGKIHTEFEQEGKKGYAVAFQGLVKYIMGKLPQNEIIKDALRETHSLYPEIAIRELIANALIHQDFSVTGTNPMIEIFDNRIEISNAGKPLIDVLRLIDYQPKSRNEKLANLMRQMRICEERGSGIDKVIDAIEYFQLPAPKFIAEDDFFKVILFAPLSFEDMDKNDRIRATYQHYALKFSNQEYMNNTTLRERFGLEKKAHPKASKAISDTLNKGLIKPANPENRSTKHIKYIPFYG